jgi:protoporphyrin/coproporphyrin ferrochelatase
MTDKTIKGPRTAILLLAYGTPDSPEAIEPYYTHIRGGRPPSPEAIADLERRYVAVGGCTPLTILTEQVRQGVELELSQRGLNVSVYVGMKHWHPWIANTVLHMKTDGVTRVIGVVLAPHYSRFSVGGYQRYLFAGMEEHDATFTVDFVEQWHDDPAFLEFMAAQVNQQLERFDAAVRDRVVVLFSAHSLPERIRSWNDPYEAQLAESARNVATRAGVADHRVVWQSAGNTGEPWIGPNVLDYLDILHQEGVRHVLQVPIGFVSDHLEILYDLDIEATQKAMSLGIEYRRTMMPNAQPAFLDVLAGLCHRAVLGEGIVSVTTPPPSTRRPDEVVA